MVITVLPTIRAVTVATARPAATVLPRRTVPGGAVVQVAASPFAGFGWAYVQDGAHTAAAPLRIAAGVKTALTIDGFGPSTDLSYLRAPFAGWPFWHDGRFWPYSIGDEYTLRLDFAAQSLAINNAVRATLDIGGLTDPTFDDYQLFGVGAGVRRNFRFTIPIFDKTTFDTNGAVISVTPDAPMTLWSQGLFIRPGGVGTPR